MYSSTLDTPAGPFTVVADEDAVHASGWTADVDSLVALIHPTLRPARVSARQELGRFTDAVRAYHAGDLHAIDTVPVRQASGEFLVAAWKALRDVPAGAPVTYTGLAALAGRPSAVRAAASACARNAAALFVPCHRVLRTGGSVGGFRYGPDVKRWLLAHES
jgi:methylated-DNA-[protein]-cysteine S-methyltransferase